MTEFERQTFTIAPGARRPYDEDDWRDTLVVVERGELELECESGGRRSFPTGNVLFLVGLPVRALHNRGPETTRLVAISRRRGGSPGR